MNVFDFTAVTSYMTVLVVVVMGIERISTTLRARLT